MRSLALRLRSLFRRGHVERELDSELQFHLEHKMEEGIARGLSPEQARREALLALGGVEQVKEECRDRRRVNLIEHLFQDLGYALRNLRKNPGFATVAILTLALGIGANTALFSLVDAVLLKSLPVCDPARLYFVDNAGTKGANGGPPYPCFELMRDGTHSFEGMAAFSSDTPNLNIDGHLEQPHGIFASGSFFQVLGVRPAIGRLLTPADERLDPPVAVLGYAYWQRRFGGDPSVIGKTVRDGERNLTIVGVTPPEFAGIKPGFRVDITVPITMQDPTLLHERGSWWLDIVARLKRGVSPEQARAEVEPIFETFMRDAPGPPSGAEFRREYFNHMELLPAAKGMDDLRKRFSQPLAVLMAVVGSVLLIGCANLANLFLARASSRRREFAVRLAIGAGRGRLVRQLLTETLLLFSCGAAVGLAFAGWGIQLLASYFAVGRLPIMLDAHLDLPVLAFTASLTLLTGLIFGLAPALSAVRTDAYPALQGAGTRSTATRAHVSMRQLLVVGQVTLSLVLVVAAGFFVRTLANLDKLDPGFRSEHVVTLSVQPLGLPFGPRLSAFWADLPAYVERVAGVRSASLSLLTPLSGRYRGVLVNVPGFVPRSAHDNQIGQNQVSPGYFETLGIPLIAGRNFTASDSAAAPKVAILNETAAKFYFADRKALGGRLEFRRQSGPESYEVIGVVRDTKNADLREEPPRFVFVPVAQPRDFSPRLTLAVKALGDPASVLAAVQKQVSALGSNVLVTEAMPMREQVDATLVQERLLSVLSGFFGVLALLLSAVGLYGILAQVLHQKTNEIGIRIALGARGGQVVWMVLNRSLGLVGIGVMLGLPVALVAIRTLKSLLFGLAPTDVPTVALGAGVLLITAGLASYLPARRAARVDPMVALRYE